MPDHHYAITCTWTGNTGAGTSNPRAYSRAHTIGATGKPGVLLSSDPSFLGDASRYNPEELLVASLASCHQLWYLGLCAVENIRVESYADRAEGTMRELTPGGAGEFTSVTLHPVVTVRDAAHAARAIELHERAHAMCFIARSVNFPMTVHPVVTAVSGA